MPARLYHRATGLIRLRSHTAGPDFVPRVHDRTRIFKRLSRRMATRSDAGVDRRVSGPVLSGAVGADQVIFADFAQRPRPFRKTRWHLILTVIIPHGTVTKAVYLLLSKADL
ncbi:MAG: hypothetical protein A07HR60_01469 [uncultured archaeon A07HR60]|nr:MAG: hypothetical protein A07HR60_01469 [uncultured archaeon A07HR60]